MCNAIYQRKQAGTSEQTLKIETKMETYFSIKECNSKRRKENKIVMRLNFNSAAVK